MLSEFSKMPSIIFISETRVADEKEKIQKSQIKIPGFKFILDIIRQLMQVVLLFMSSSSVLSITVSSQKTH